jgi:hypothetical protein
MHVRFWFSSAVVLVAFTVFPNFALAEKRAFIAGINNYDNVQKLKTAVNDARTMSEIFKIAGFKVTLAIEPSREFFFEKWREFLTSLKPGDSAAFYFAGHGFQLDGANYLVLKDTPRSSEEALVSGSLQFHELMEQLEERSLSSSLYILDACRTSPIGTISAAAPQGQARGLAAIESVYGAFVMYSAGVNEEALDFIIDAKKESNSVYIRRLASLMRSRDLQIRDIAARVRIEVDKDAASINHKQRPVYFDGIVGNYFLFQPPSSLPPLDASSRIPGTNIVRLGGFATWDLNCKSLPAPRISVSQPPRYGRIVTRFESFMIAGTQFGPSSCVNTTQKGIGIYYIVNDDAKDRKAIESIPVTVKHWSVSPAVNSTETFDVDLVTRQSRRVTGR